MLVTGEFNFLGCKKNTTSNGKEFRNVSLLQVEDQSVNKFFIDEDLFQECQKLKVMDKVICNLSIDEGFKDGVTRTYMNLKSIAKING